MSDSTTKAEKKTAKKAPPSADELRRNAATSALRTAIFPGTSGLTFAESLTAVPQPQLLTARLISAVVMVLLAAYGLFCLYQAVSYGIKSVHVKIEEVMATDTKKSTR